MAETETRFVLKRLNWAEDYDERLTRTPGEATIASFATFEEAEAERAKREEDMRKKRNPFECGSAIQYWTHLDEPRLRDWLMDHDIEPPPANDTTPINWSAWWAANQKQLSAAKRTAVWEILDKVRFFAVAEEPVRPVGFAVLRVNWEYNDEYYDAQNEGGQVVKVFRSRERAEQECARLNERAREEWGDALGDMGDYEDEDEDEYEYGMFNMQSRLRHKCGLTPDDKLKKGEGLFKSTAGVPFFEVIEVELEGVQ